AVRAIRQFLTDPAATNAALWSATRTRTWSSPAVGYWLSGPTNQPGHHPQPSASRPGAPPPPPPPPPPRPPPGPADAAARPQPAADPSTSRLTTQPFQSLRPGPARLSCP